MLLVNRLEPRNMPANYNVSLNTINSQHIEIPEMLPVADKDLCSLPPRLSKPNLPYRLHCYLEKLTVCELVKFKCLAVRHLQNTWSPLGSNHPFTRRSVERVDYIAEHRSLQLCA